jgi:uncharacterized protein YjbJ (UPF0337 family)
MRLGDTMSNHNNELKNDLDNMQNAANKFESTKNQFKGKMNQVKGSIKMDIGKATNNPKLRIKGATDKAVGIVQEVQGKIQESISDIKTNLKK